MGSRARLDGSLMPFSNMGIADIPLDKAEFLSTLLESLLYGFSLLMFGGTIWVLVSQRSTEKVNRTMLAVACALLLFSTVHIVIDIIRIMEGLILYRDTHPGGSIGYFSDVGHWTFVSRSYVYTAQTLIGDGVILYRCYAVWKSKLVMIFPALLWCSVAVTGIINPYTALKAGNHEVFGGCLWEWITSFYTSTFMANSLTTFLLAFRIWSVDRGITRLCAQQKSRLRSISRIIVDAGMIYSFTLLAALICFVNRSNGQFVILNMVTSIISITFYMVIIRVGLNHRAAKSSLPTIECAATSDSSCTNHGGGVQIHVTTMTESKVDTSQPLPPGLTQTDVENYLKKIETHPAIVRGENFVRSYTQASCTARTR